MTWGKARKRPVIIEFRQPIPNVRGSSAEVIDTREGQIIGHKNADYIIKGVKGELYPISIEIFNETYDVIEPIQPSGEKTQ